MARLYYGGAYDSIKFASPLCGGMLGAVATMMISVVKCFTEAMEAMKKHAEQMFATNNGHRKLLNAYVAAKVAQVQFVLDAISDKAAAATKAIER